MTIKEFYDLVGGDYKTALSRMMNDDFIKRMLSKFLAKNAFPLLKQSFQEKDVKGLFEAAHAFKGVTANLALTRLYDMTCPIVEAVRDFQEGEGFDLAKEMGELEEAYLFTESKLQELLA